MSSNARHGALPRHPALNRVPRDFLGAHMPSASLSIDQFVGP